MDPIQLGKEPVSADKPAGNDAKYEPEFEELQAEIDKLASPSATETTNWKTVGTLSATILSEKAKDILVASYFAVSQIQQNGIEGLDIGLTVYHDLITTYWEDLFPKKKRIKGRINAIEWWSEKMESALLQAPKKPVGQEFKEGLVDRIHKIENFLNENLPSPISLRPIERAVETFEVTAPKPPDPPPPEPSPPAEKEAPAPPAETKQAVPKPPPPKKVETQVPQVDPVSVETPEDVQKGIDAGLTAIRKTAHFIFENDYTNPSSYRYLRMAAWGGIESLPVTSEGKKTMIPPPEDYLKMSIQDLVNKKDYRNLLDVCESNVPEYLMWLDLTRYSAEALSGLGGACERAVEAINLETGVLLQRLPELPEYTFNDGTPFADSETREWLKSVSLGGGGGGMDGNLAMVGGGEDSGLAQAVADTLKAAKELSSKKKIRDAVLLIQDKLNQSLSNQENLLWRIALCQVLISSKKADVAIQHLERILADIDRYHLEEWAPSLALNGLGVVLNGFSIHGEQEIKDRSKVILRRIAMLDPAAALNVAT